MTQNPYVKRALSMTPVETSLGNTTQKLKLLEIMLQSIRKMHEITTDRLPLSGSFIAVTVYEET